MSRSHHYVFAHVALREIFLDDPRGVSMSLMEKGPDLIFHLWDVVGEKITERDADAEILSPAGLQLNVRELGKGYYANILTMPQPEELPEAYFVGMVVRPEAPRLWGLLGTRKLEARYITLEYGLLFGTDGSVDKRTVLCEWTDRDHINFGEGPEPTLDSFVTGLSRLVGALEE